MALPQEKSGANNKPEFSEPNFSFHDDDLSQASFDKDLAAAIAPNFAQDFDNTTKNHVLRKIDLYLIPWMWLGYGFVYYDKVRRYSPLS